MTTGRNIYLACMCVAGIVVGATALVVPAVGSSFATTFTILLVISFVVDVVLMRVVPAGRVSPLTMEARFAGFFSAVILYLLVTFLFGQGLPSA